LVKKDLERVGTLDETADGVAGFHASGRHSHVTGLLRIGASITEARELARHSDVRMRTKYTHIGLEDKARALALLPAPGAAQDRFSSASGVSGRHASASVDTNEFGGTRPGNDETPSGEGVSSSVVTDCQERSADLIQ